VKLGPRMGTRDKNLPINPERQVGQVNSGPRMSTSGRNLPIHPVRHVGQVKLGPRVGTSEKNLPGTYKPSTVPRWDR
jgi:hypothetical protein